MFSRRHIAVLASLLALAGPPVYASGLSPCTITIGKAVEKYTKQKQKAIAKCEDGRSDGRLAPTVNCRPAAGPVTDPATATALASAAALVQPSIDPKCSGPLPSLGGPCNSATTNAQLAACITAPAQDADVDNRNVDTLIGTVYDTNAPVTDVGLRKCQATIGKQGADLDPAYP